MIGAELLSSSQLVYLSLCLPQEPSFLLSSLSEFRLVTGYWSLFAREEDEELLPGFTDRVELSPSFADSCLAVVGTLLLGAVIWAVLAAARSCLSPYQQRKIFRREEQIQARCCLLYTSPSPRDQRGSRMPSSA